MNTSETMIVGIFILLLVLVIAVIISVLRAEHLRPKIFTEKPPKLSKKALSDRNKNLSEMFELFNFKDKE